MKDGWVDPEKLVENKQAKILWDFSLKADVQMPHNQPDILIAS